MEPLPRGANFQRRKLLWEIGLRIAGDPATPLDVPLHPGAARWYREHSFKV